METATAGDGWKARGKRRTGSQDTCGFEIADRTRRRHEDHGHAVGGAPVIPGLASWRGAAMFCGTTSNAGKSTLVTGICRLLAREGVSVAPFKAQNMSLNSVVTVSGGEIGRAQGAQAAAAEIAAEVAMNPILLKPTGDRTSQVIVMGRPIGTMTAIEYHARKPELLPVVLDALADLRRRFDVVVCEGAGSPAEINLLDHDIVNLRVADEAGMDALVVGDIDLGGVFASLYGTVALLPDALRRRVRGFVINKLRGDPALLLDGCARLGELTGVPTLGVLPWLPGPGIDAEDSLALREPEPAPIDGDVLDIAVVRFPRISNFTDLEPLRAEPCVRLRFVEDAASLGRPDLVVLPGSKATVADLQWLRDRQLDRALVESDAVLLGICGGYQMLGDRIDDPVESGAGTVSGLGLLPVTTIFATDKVTQNCTGVALGRPVTGYRIHHGRVAVHGGDPFVVIDGAVEGTRVDRVLGTTLHGLLESDEVRVELLAEVATRRGKRFRPAAVAFADRRVARVDELADAIAEHLDLNALGRIVNAAAPVRR